MPDNTFTDEDFFDRLIYEDRVPLAVELLDAPMADVDILHDTKANEKLLRSMSVHEENDLVDPDNEMSDLQNEVRLLNHKVNLLMTILSDLVKQQLKLPETTHIKFNTRGIRFCVDPTDKLFPVGKMVRLGMYLSPDIPKPLMFSAEIVEYDNADDWVSARFFGQSNASKALLDKIIFRHHRRQVASFVDNKSG
ncbi:MAG: hypothetical protein HON77_02090 [Gammaproteobacteria bacterium]|nr:hypothetical protein [Gammaproteobacteria bacterium]MBT6583071.1 hypothetical protein [Gammaproteobacteria bacterium]